MKKPSKEWKEFGQIISIVDIKIAKYQRILSKLKKEKEKLVNLDQKLWNEINFQQVKLKELNIENYVDNLKGYFGSREKLKSNIESIFFDASVNSQKIKQVDQDIESHILLKASLEKRKDALVEVRHNYAG
ncbi:hypothetical protein EJ063_07530 [Vibrio aquaticus]|uniref:Uncharacterized protein n=1 Tax=Vibrio aquaticus TaxID=2496559 RepID=A0A3S0P7A3_9VIBR|nr:hypothetical protein [Vibrio aquaticus]RTZ16637.1 hypothetical protein EJ063_07530 [Vibrio aquaticus]